MSKAVQHNQDTRMRVDLGALDDTKGAAIALLC